MKTCSPFLRYSAVLLCASLAEGARAYVANLNVDWRFAKIGENIRGLDAAREALKGVRPDAWETVSVPHCVNAADSYDGHALDAGEKDLFRGWMCYEKTFTVPAGKHFFVEFETVRQSLYVYVNGSFAGFYEAGIAPSGYDITPFVKPGEAAKLTVITENTGSRGTDCYSKEMKEKPGDWGGEEFQWSGTDFNPIQGGLVGNVKLHVKENDSYITLPLWNTLGTKGVYIWYDGDVHVEAEIQTGGGDALVPAPRMARPDELRYEIVGLPPGEKPKTWSPDTPYLYDVKVALLGKAAREGASSTVVDEVTIRTGFRTVAFKPSDGLYLNGKRVWLPGYAQRSTDSWAAIGYAPDWLQDFDANLIRASGARFVRFMHVAPKPGPVRAYDKAGVVCVAPAGDKEREATGRQWAQRVEAMRATIVYFRNSPSVLFWEAGNNQISSEHMREMRLLKEELDPHGGRFMGCRTLNTAAQIAEAEYVGTMIHRLDTAAYAAMRANGKFLPMVETEYCREESARRLWDRYTPPDYNFNCVRLASGAKQWMYNCYDQTQEDFALSNASTSDGYGYFYGNRVGGRLGQYYVACAMLCWSDSNQHGRNSHTENCRSSGRVDAVRLPKESFYVHQVMYSDTPKVKILGHWNYPPFNPDTYWYNEKVNDGVEITYTGARKQRDPKHKTVYVMGSLSVYEIELFVNGRSKGRVSSPHLFDFAFNDVDVTESGVVEAVGYDKDGKEVCRDKIETVGSAARLVMTATTGPKGFLADGSDLAMIDLKLVDAEGRTLPLATNRINFAMTFAPSSTSTSNLQPVFVGGWNSGTFGETSPIGKNWVNLECGVNRVFIRAGRTPGKVTLTARCGGEGAPAPRQGAGVWSGDALVPATVAIDLQPVAVTDGLAADPPQAYPMNVSPTSSFFLLTSPSRIPPQRDLDGVPGAVTYTVEVNEMPVVFPKGAKPYKPDTFTGVVAPYGDVLDALKLAGVQLAYRTGKGVLSLSLVGRSLRERRDSPDVPATAAHTVTNIECEAGSTVIWENNRTDKNLTNFEFEMKGNRLVGELGPLLGYIPGLKVAIAEGDRKVKITTLDGAGAPVQQNVFRISPPEFQSPSYAFRNGERAFLKFRGIGGDFKLDSVNYKKPVSLGEGVFDVTACLHKAGEMNILLVNGKYDSVILETVPQQAVEKK